MGADGRYASHSLFGNKKLWLWVFAANLAHEGKFRPRQLVTFYLPEMEGVAFSNATVRQVMDMSTAFQYSESYLDKNSEIFNHMCSGGMVPAPDVYNGPLTVRDFCTMMKRENPVGQHGISFTYRSINTDILVWIVEHVLGGGPSDFDST